MPIPFRHRGARSFACLAVLIPFLHPCAALGYDVVTIGDSWAGFIANGAPGSEGDSGTGNALQTVLDRTGSGKTVYNGSFYGGTAEDHLTRLSEIVARIKSSGATVVYLSSGGNDLLAGKLGGGIYLGHPDPAGLIDEVTDRVGQILDGILDVRPDIQVVIGGYDYVNMWDTDPSDGGLGQFLRRNYGLGLDGTGYIGLGDPLYLSHLEDVYRPQQQEFGRLLRDVERSRSDLGANSRRVHFVENLGANNQVSGYAGIFGSLPPGLPIADYGDYPVTVTRMGSGGQDPIHLDTTGYETISLNCFDTFLENAFEDGKLAVDKTSVEYEAVLVGQDALETVTASNAGMDFTKIGIRFSPGTGPFGGGDAEGMRYLFQDPKLGSDTASASFTFSPVIRGVFRQTIPIEVEYGEEGSVLLEGSGVAPVNEVRVGDPVYVRVGTSGAVTLDVTNTGDGNLSGMGEESNLRGAMSLQAGAGFQGVNVSGISLPDGASAEISVPFLPVSRGVATVEALFDFVNGHGDGTNGPDSFTVSLQATGVGPVFSAGTRVSLGAVEIASAGYESFQVANLTDDPDGGESKLTVLTLLSADITGAGADFFELVGFVPGMTMKKGDPPVGLAIRAFNDGTHLGPCAATLTFLTDVGAAPGRVGASYGVPLSAVFVPEPSVFLTAGFLGIALLTRRQRITGMPGRLV